MGLRFALRARPVMAILACTAVAALLACEIPPTPLPLARTATPAPTPTDDATVTEEIPDSTTAPVTATVAPTGTAASTPTEAVTLEVTPDGTMVPATATVTLAATVAVTLEETPDGTMALAAATATPTPTATVTPTATPVDDAIIDNRDDWINHLLNHPGYKPEWGEPQYGGVYKTADPRHAFRFQTTLGYGPFSRWQFAAHNSLLMQDPWGTIRDTPICDLCESFEVSADGLTYTFVLRDNVQFHEEGWAKDQGAPGFGTELACEDIKASHEWFAKPPPGDPYASFIRSGEFYMGHLA